MSSCDHVMHNSDLRGLLLFYFPLKCIVSLLVLSVSSRRKRKPADGCFPMRGQMTSSRPTDEAEGVRGFPSAQRFSVEGGVQDG